MKLTSLQTGQIWFGVAFVVALLITWPVFDGVNGQGLGAAISALFLAVLFVALFRVLFGSRDAPRPSVDIPGLGLAEFNTEDGFWQTTVSAPEGTFLIRFDGEEHPNEEHFTHAREIKAGVPEFQSMLRTFLADEAAKYSSGGEEIQALTLESVCLWVRGRPGDGMIYFNGPDEDRVWRCDDVDRKPRGLGFDS